MIDRASPALLALVAVAVLCLLDVGIKWAAQTTAPLAIAFWRFAFGAIYAAAVWRLSGAPAITAEMWRAHALRGVLVATSGFAFFYALAVLPLALAITLGFVAPLLVPFFAWLVLGEKPRASNLAAAALGFLGAVVASFGAVPAEGAARAASLTGLGAAVAAAVAYAMSLVLLRGRAGRDGAPIVSLMQTVWPAAMLAIPAFTLASLPSAIDIARLALVAALGVTGWYLMIKAYSRAAAQALAPIEFTALIWAALFGFALFGERPRLEVFAGAALIIGGCLYSIWSERTRAPA